MVPRLQDHQVAAVDEVHDAMLFVDPARPSPGQRVRQLLRLADALEGIRPGIVDPAVDPPDDSSIGLDPEV